MKKRSTTCQCITLRYLIYLLLFSFFAGFISIAFFGIKIRELLNVEVVKLIFALPFFVFIDRLLSQQGIADKTAIRLYAVALFVMLQIGIICLVNFLTLFTHGFSYVLWGVFSLLSGIIFFIFWQALRKAAKVHYKSQIPP